MTAGSFFGHDALGRIASGFGCFASDLTGGPVTPTTPREAGCDPDATSSYDERNEHYAPLEVCRCPDHLRCLHCCPGLRRLVFARRLPPELCCSVRVHRRTDVLRSCRTGSVRRRSDLLCPCGTRLLRSRCCLQLRLGRSELLCTERLLQHGPELLCSDRMQHVRHGLHPDAPLLCAEEEELPRSLVGPRKAKERLPEENVPGMGELSWRAESSELSVRSEAK
jgi:hypothetical protein